jgi:transposase
MQRIRYTEEFKKEAIKQVIERGYTAVDVSKRLGISEKSLYAWLRKNKAATSPAGKDLILMKQELNRVKAELKRTTEERDILKKAAEYSMGQCNT